MNAGFWRGKKVLLTGHTGFKGSWTATVLSDMGALVTGISLAPIGTPSFWSDISSRLSVTNHIVDLRDKEALERVVRSENPQIVIHMAAQALVRESYRNPIDTYTSNVIGTVNLLDILRLQNELEVILVVTSDKVYKNKEQKITFNEEAELGGSDPYSASKAACEIIARSYAESFFNSMRIPLVTARAGNVIGGGDWSPDRIVPDICRAALNKRPVELRYPNSTRPWQHVLTCIDGYLRYIEYVSNAGLDAPTALNFGPLNSANITVAELAENLGRALGNDQPWILTSEIPLPEKQTLALDCRKSQSTLKWAPTMDGTMSIDWTAAWYVAASRGADTLALTRQQIARYSAL